jgi:hypothetical protein
MFTLHISSQLSSCVRRGLALSWVLVAMALATQAQTQAACTFNFFSPTTPFKLPDGTPIFMQPIGINDFGTIVGYSSPGKARGLIRWANGGVTRVTGTSQLFARNDHGTSVGFDLTGQGILVNRTTISPILLDVNNGGIKEVRGINRWGTIVGRYRLPNNAGGRGFKRWNTGTTHTLTFPGGAFTAPIGINDNGTVVGAAGADHGFIFHNGQWATLDYPGAQAPGFTNLVGITNAGKIIGNAFSATAVSITTFLYENGTFKVISVPNSVPGSASLRSISPKLGLILGVTDVATGSPAFIAQCQ